MPFIFRRERKDTIFRILHTRWIQRQESDNAHSWHARNNFDEIRLKHALLRQNRIRDSLIFPPNTLKLFVVTLSKTDLGECIYIIVLGRKMYAWLNGFCVVIFFFFFHFWILRVCVCMCIFFSQLRYSFSRLLFVFHANWITLLLLFAWQTIPGFSCTLFLMYLFHFSVGMAFISPFCVKMHSQINDVLSQFWVGMRICNEQKQTKRLSFYL